MRKKSFWWGGLIVLAAAARLFASEPPAVAPVENVIDVNAWVQSYYTNPTPQLAETALRQLVAEKTLVNSGARQPLTAFFSRVFAANPDRLSAWGKLIDTFDDGSQSTLWVAMRWADTADARALIAARANDSTVIGKFCGRLLAEDGHDFSKVKTPSPSDLDGNWGSFFATGDARYVRVILLAAAGPETKELDRMVTRGAAQWSLRSLYPGHPRIRDIAADFIATEATPEQKAVLLKVLIPGPGGVPTTGPAPAPPSQGA